MVRVASTLDVSLVALVVMWFIMECALVAHYLTENAHRDNLVA